MKKSIKFLPTLAIIPLISGCFLFSGTTLAEEIRLNKVVLHLTPNQTDQLTATVLPENASNKKVTWSSSKTNAASVSEDGLVSSNSLGESVITATSKDRGKAFAKCHVFVTETLVSLIDIEIKNPVTTYSTGDTLITPTVIAKYDDSTTFDVSSVVEISGYNLSEVGTQTVNVSYTENNTTKSASYEIKVENSVQPSGLKRTEIKSTCYDYINNNFYDLSATPSIGTAKDLVIPVWFRDSTEFIKPTQMEEIRSDIEKAYFGTNEETGWRSVKTYYSEESHGKFNLTGTVSDWYEIEESYVDYAKGKDVQKKTSELANNAIDWYFRENPFENRKDYDRNNDGHIDGLMLIYAAPNYISLNRKSYDNLWAYCNWSYLKSDIANPNLGVFFWASYDFMYSKDLSEQKTGLTRYGFGDTTNCNVDTHTYIHEMGHTFGLEDYYDYSNYSYKPAGEFSMQDENVGGHDPYSVMSLGWANPYIPRSSQTMKIRPFSTSGDLILLTPEWNEYDSAFDEYLLLELYTPTGLNEFDTMYQYKSRKTGPTEVGIRLWHVDARLAYYGRNNFTLSKPDGFTENPNCTSGNVYLMQSNTYYDENEDGHLSPLGKNYYNFNLLQLIRNNVEETYAPLTPMSNGSLFKENSLFDIYTFRNQFVNGNRSQLNRGLTFGWTFTVDSCDSSGATITVTRA